MPTYTTSGNVLIPKNFVLSPVVVVTCILIPRGVMRGFRNGSPSIHRQRQLRRIDTSRACIADVVCCAGHRLTRCPQMLPATACTVRCMHRYSNEVIQCCRGNRRSHTARCVDEVIYTARRCEHIKHPRRDILQTRTRSIFAVNPPIQHAFYSLGGA